ncbi:MAG: ATP-binding protein [bacterium]|nr:ATP-binding protein [bacterium]
MALSNEQHLLLRECSKDEQAYQKLLKFCDELQLNAASTDHLTDFLHQALVQNFPNGSICLYDHDLRCVLVGGDGPGYYGLTAEDFIGKQFRDLFPLPSVEPLEAMMRQAFEGETRADVFHYVDHIYDIHVRPVFNDAGVVEYGLFMSQNISEHKRLEAQLQATAQRLDTILASLPAMIFRARFNLNQVRYEYVSPRSQEVTGLTPEEIDREPERLYEQLPPEFRPAFFAQVQAAVARSEPFIWENWMNVGAERRWRRIAAFPTHQDDGSVLLDGVELDATAQKLGEETLIRQTHLQGALQKEQELNDLKTKMMVRLSHEFRTPLAVILTSSELLERYYERLTPEKRTTYFDRIRFQVHNITHILDDIYVTMQVQTHQIKQNAAVFDLGHVCREAVAHLLTLTSSKQPIQVETHGDKHLVFADENLIDAAISGIVLNAMKYSPSDKPIYLRVMSEGENVQVQVQDSGIGIPAADLPHVFDAFFRGSNINEISGVGVGLTLTREVVRLYGGDVELTSVEGEGTTVTLRLPRHLH